MLSRKITKHLLGLVLNHANSLQIKAGVAAIKIVNIHNNEFIVDYLPLHSQIERPANPDILDDIGTNYFCVAFSKIGEMISTGMNSGNSSIVPKKGELGYRGGIIWRNQNFIFYLAFSGGTEEQDLDCVNSAEKAFFEQLPLLQLISA